MIDEPSDEMEQIAAEWIQEGWIRREEICAQLGIGDDLLEMCIQWQIIDEPESGPEGTFVFSANAVERLCRGLRLHRDLGINWEGVSVAMDLLDRIDHLEQQMQWFSSDRTMRSEDDVP